MTIEKKILNSKCYKCSGIGKLNEKECDICKGTGQYKEDFYYVIDEKQKISFSMDTLK